MTRNLAIDWIKGWMILCVLLVHTFSFPHQRFYLAVDVFFFISGFYMMMSFLRKPTTTVQYTWKRIRVIALPFFVCLLLRYLLASSSLIHFKDMDDFVEEFAKLFYTVLFAEELGITIPSDGLLLGSWYFSVLIIGSFLLYGMLEFNEKLSTRILFPMIALFGFNSLIAHADSFSIWDRVDTLGTPLIRGCSEMAAGALICSVYQENKSAFERHSVFVNIMGFLAFVLFIFIIFAPTVIDKYLVITVPWFLLSSVIEGSWLSRGLDRIHGGLMSWIGRNTLYILCAHGPTFILVFWCNEHLFGHTLHGIGLAATCIIAVIPATFLLYYVCTWIKKTATKK